jgi:pilus assembly protein CpaF
MDLPLSEGSASSRPPPTSITDETEIKAQTEGESPKAPAPVQKTRRPMALDDSQPWWLKEPKKSTNQIDALINIAREIFIDGVTPDATNQQVHEAINRALESATQRLINEMRITQSDIEEAGIELRNLVFGKGPLQPLYDDPAVTDVYVDSWESIKCLRRGQALDTPFRFRSPSEYEAFTNAMLRSVSTVLDIHSPLVECVLDDEYRTRVSGVHPSLRDDHEPGFVLRIPRLQQISFYDLLRLKTLPASLAGWLAEFISLGEGNLLVVGSTGAGKTSMATALLSAVSSDERICTIEDVPEIFIPTSHVEKLVTRPKGMSGEAEITLEQLLRAVLRRAPHRIVVGEIRDKEASLFLRALETGHSGSVATLHASSCKEGLWRLLDMVSAYESAPFESIQRRVSRSIHLIVAMSKVNGKPCLQEISEVHRPEDGDFSVVPILRFEKEDNGSRRWRLLTRDSEWIRRMNEKGIELKPGPSLLPPYEEEKKVEPNPEVST